MNIKDLLILAKRGDSSAMETLLEAYRPLMVNNAIINGVFDEDLFQELQIVFMHCFQPNFPAISTIHSQRMKGLGLSTA